MDAVFLDVGGVFQLPTAACVLPVLARYGASVQADDLRRCHYAGMAAYDRSTAAIERDWWAEYLQAYARAAGMRPEDIPDLVPSLRSAFRANPCWATRINESVAALRDLVDRGVRVALVSNSDGSIEARLREDGTCQVGEGGGITVCAVLDSHVVGISKPDPGIFHLALQATDSRPERALHVGDSVRADVCGARAAGVHPLHLDPFGMCPDTDHDHIRAVSDLLERR